MKIHNNYYNKEYNNNLSAKIVIFYNKYSKNILTL